MAQGTLRMEQKENTIVMTSQIEGEDEQVQTYEFADEQQATEAMKVALAKVADFL